MIPNYPSIASAFGISARYLHMLFTSEHLNVSSYIRGRRLEGVGRQLLAPISSNKSVTEIAFSWGFNAVSYFCRTFCTSFSQTATAYRQTGGAGVKRH